MLGLGSRFFIFGFCLFLTAYPRLSHAEGEILSFRKSLKDLSRTFESELFHGKFAEAQEGLQKLSDTDSGFFDYSRFLALQRAYPYFLLFVHDGDSLRLITKMLYEEEIKLLGSIKRLAMTASDYDAAMRTFQTYNPVAYGLMSLTEAESVYAAILDLPEVSRSKVIRQYEVFRRIFRIKDEDNGSDMKNPKRDFLHRDLHHLDLNLSIRARFFLEKIDRAFTNLDRVDHPLALGYMDQSSHYLELFESPAVGNGYDFASQKIYQEERQADLLEIADSFLDGADKQPGLPAAFKKRELEKALVKIRESDPLLLLDRLPKGHPYEGLNLLQIIFLYGKPEALTAAIEALQKGEGWFIPLLEEPL